MDGDSRYLRLRAMWSLPQLFNSVVEVQKQPWQHLNEWAWLWANKTAWQTLKFKFHVSSFEFFQPLKNVKTIFSSRAVQKWATGPMWCTGHSLLAPDLDNLIAHEGYLNIHKVSGITSKDQSHLFWGEGSFIFIFYIQRVISRQFLLK